MDAIKEVWEKISSYNIFNYLFPGILFVYIAKEFIGYNLIQNNNLKGFFLYYFIGMIVSRCGSLFIEPFLKKIRFVKFESYKNYVEASKKDNKIELLSEVNNTYRTLLAMLFALCALKIYLHIKLVYKFSHFLSITIISVSVIILFLLSYRKQTKYITQRIQANTP
jgi:hypothetical protein